MTLHHVPKSKAGCSESFNLVRVIKYRALHLHHHQQKSSASSPASSSSSLASNWTFSNASRMSFDGFLGNCLTGQSLSPVMPCQLCDPGLINLVSCDPGLINHFQTSSPGLINISTIFNLPAHPSDGRGLPRQCTRMRCWKSWVELSTQPSVELLIFDV